MKRPIGVSILLALLAFAPRADALQPLDTFVSRAIETNPDLRVATATASQRDAEADRATGTLLPSFQAQGTYTRNQYEISFPGTLLGGGGSITILPRNQFDGSLTLSVPLVDVGGWERRAAAKATLDAARADLASSRLDVSRRVARAYFQIVANEAVLASAQRSLQLSQENAALTVTKRNGGTASELDVQRAKGDVARAEQDVTAAGLNVVTARRSLETLSGLVPEPVVAARETDDLHEEAPLEAWMTSLDHVPAIQSAMAARRSAEKTAGAADAAWLPTLTGSAQERLTNAPSLTLHNEYYLLQLVATWRVDATVPATVRAQRSAASAVVARSDATRRQTEDAIFGDWQQVHASIERAQSARRQVEAAVAAAGLARDRYDGGVATQLDVLQAQQDVFRAEVSRIQADSDLAYARASLRLDSAHALGDRHP